MRIAAERIDAETTSLRGTTAIEEMTDAEMTVVIVSLPGIRVTILVSDEMVIRTGTGGMSVTGRIGTMMLERAETTRTDADEMTILHGRRTIERGDVGRKNLLRAGMILTDGSLRSRGSLGSRRLFGP